MQSRSFHRFGAALLSILLVSAMGCRALKNSSAFKPQSAANSETSYQLKAVVLGKSALVHEITVHQNAIPHFEPTMNAVYKIKDRKIFEQLQPGDWVTGEVVPAPTHSYNRLEQITIASRPKANFNPSTLPPHRLLLGEQVPNIPLVDQNGKKIDFQRYRGKALLITFIDSKCTDDCPIVTRHFEAVNSLLAKEPKAFAHSHLLTISIDPKNDTPPVLRRYGLEYLHGNAAGFSHWEFADLTPANLKRMAAAFGVVYVQTKTDIDHTMQTALIGKDGTLVHVWAGDEWNPSVLAKAVASAAASKASTTKASNT